MESYFVSLIISVTPAAKLVSNVYGQEKCVTATIDDAEGASLVIAIDKPPQVMHWCIIWSSMKPNFNTSQLNKIVP